MLRSKTTFPFLNNELCSFMKKMWVEGCFDDYSSEHFLIKALEKRMDNFAWDKQFVNNNIDSIYNVTSESGDIDYEKFSTNFCINLSLKLSRMSTIFGEATIKRFITDQFSAGKDNYKQNTFFQALSEIEILSFFHRGFGWKEVVYEPSVGLNGSNPEAYFIGDVCDRDSKGTVEVKVNIEVKTPEFPQLSSHQGNFIMPMVLLAKKGRGEIPKVCKENNFEFINPRVNKLVDFINSAAKKFNYPKENEYNLLYVNWAYCDFPSNSFLEAWSLLTNEYNGLLTHPEIATVLPLREPVSEEAYKKITAVIVYTSSIEQLMFCDFRHVWQRNGAGCKFRMFVVDEELRDAELTNESDLLYKISGMKPDKADPVSFLVGCDLHESLDAEACACFFDEMSRLIVENALK